MIAEYRDPMTSTTKKTKGVTAIVVENEHRYEGWNQGPDGELFKGLELVYTRR